MLLFLLYFDQIMKSGTHKRLFQNIKTLLTVVHVIFSFAFWRIKSLQNKEKFETFNILYILFLHPFILK